jgi:hypothetical protein
MRQSSIQVPQTSNRAGATSCTKKNGTPAGGTTFSTLARQTFPKNTAEHIRALTGKSIRSCKYYLAGAHEPPYRVFLAIYRESVSRLQ